MKRLICPGKNLCFITECDFYLNLNDYYFFTSLANLFERLFVKFIKYDIEWQIINLKIQRLIHLPSG